MPKKKTNEEFLEEIKPFTGSEYTFLEEYKTGHTKIKIVHNICKFEYLVSPTKFKGGRQCPRCSKCERMDTESFKEKVFSIVKDEYEVRGEYTNNKNKVLMKHNCGNLYSVSPDMFLNKNRRCPSCSSSINSIGVKTIKKFLTEKGINYIQEKTFDELVSGSGYNYRFDFFIEETNTIIEYDGIQHFKPVKLWGGDEYLQEVKKSDIIKNNFCTEKGINIIRIEYTNNEMQINNILAKEFCSTTIPDTGVGSSDPKH